MLDALGDDAALRARLEAAAEVGRAAARAGRVADYIPALARVPPERFAIALCAADGREAAVGDADAPFSIQSISKLFNLALALEWLGEDVWSRVGREPSGMRFNSIIQLELERGVPRNPFINAGALAVVDALLRRNPILERRWREVMRRLAEDDGIGFDDEVFASEREHGDLNRALAFFLKAHGNLREDAIRVTEAYFRFCATAMSARALARAARFLIGPPLDFCPVDIRCDWQRPRLTAMMALCGLYDGSGDFAYRVGLPGKSGVGGGVLAVAPGRFSVCVWSPPLDPQGNSAGGVAALEALTHA